MPRYELPITSERAGRLPPVAKKFRERGARRLLADGVATLLAVAEAYYNGDMDEAKRRIYPAKGF